MDEVSKTKRKKGMLELQALGEELTLLNREQLEQLELSEPLLEAVEAAKRMNRFGARRRQMQYVGRLMREVSAEPIREKLDTIRGRSRAHAAWLHKIERLRERLLSDETALAEFAAEHPEADLLTLQALVRDAKTGNDKRSYRELFHELRKIFPE
ncbi:MAG: ribosome biogenesis factor YjgA [Burkholderiales bacterium]